MSVMPTEPRVPGGRYVNGYWQDSYTVEAMWSQVRPGIPGWGRDTGWLRVRWSDGHATVHCTPWDPRKDRAL